MRQHPLIILADDLTGAAEIAGIAHQAGLRSVVHTGLPGDSAGADVIICDTDTRLSTPARAAARVKALATALAARPNGGFFKKVDSVLRGPVLAEVRACAEALGSRRSILLPCNPSLGRVIRDGRYFVGGQPLHRTAFARDPFHPRKTSDVHTLLGADDDDSVASRPTASRLPAAGVIIGEADTPADVTFWAGQVDRHTLPAGGADFFRAWLQSRRSYRARTAPAAMPAGGTLLLSGSSAAPDPITPLPGDFVSINPRHRPTPQALAADLQESLTRDGFASVVMSRTLSRDPKAPTALRRLLALTARRLQSAKAFHHLIIAGGATASSIFTALDWHELEVVHIWGPGVATLRPTAAPEFVVTLKPGSYSWPASLIRELQAANAA